MLLLLLLSLGPFHQVHYVAIAQSQVSNGLAIVEKATLHNEPLLPGSNSLLLLDSFLQLGHQTLQRAERVKVWRANKTVRTLPLEHCLSKLDARRFPYLGLVQAYNRYSQANIADKLTRRSTSRDSHKSLAKLQTGTSCHQYISQRTGSFNHEHTPQPSHFPWLGCPSSDRSNMQNRTICRGNRC